MYIELKNIINDNSLDLTQKSKNTFNKGLEFFYGDGEDKNTDIALELILWSAEQNLKQAQYIMGMFHSYDNYEVGLERDHLKAKEWFKKSANQEYGEAYYELARIYYHGMGVTKDYSKAMDYFKLAAKESITEAYRYLGEIYDNGYCGIQDYDQAVLWYTKAAEHGDGLATNNLACMYQDGTGVKKNYVKAYQLFERGAQLGNKWAMGNLAYCYGEGQGTVKDDESALKWYKASADLNNPVAQRSAGLYYFYGIGCEKNNSMAYKYLRTAFDNGEVSVAGPLASCYLNGLGTDKDFLLAEEMYLLDIDYNNNAKSELLLANLYTNWPKKQPDYSEKVYKGIEILKVNAFQKRSGEAYWNLGLLYEFGMHVQQDFNKAVDYYNKAVSLGFTKAMDNISHFKKTLVGKYVRTKS